MEDLIITHRDAGMTPLMVLIAVISTYITQVSIFAYLHLIHVSNTDTFALPPSFFCRRNTTEVYISLIHKTILT